MRDQNGTGQYTLPSKDDNVIHLSKRRRSKRTKRQRRQLLLTAILWVVCALLFIFAVAYSWYSVTKR